MEYGERIAVLRKSRGMTQSELGNELNVTFQAVSKWERGESYPDFGTMSKIAKLFGVPITYFEDGIIPGQNETAATAAVEPSPAPVPAVEPAPLLLGICSVCGKGVYNENEIAQKVPKLVCTDCRRKQTERAENERLADVRKGRFWRNVGLIVAGAICLAIMIYFICRTTQLRIMRDKGQSVDFSDDYADKATITHEYGHILYESLLRKSDYVDKVSEELEAAKNRSHSGIVSAETRKRVISKIRKQKITEYIQEIKEIAQMEDTDVVLRDNMSTYGNSDLEEFFAEAFLNSQGGRPNIVGRAMQKFLDRRFK